MAVIAVLATSTFTAKAAHADLLCMTKDWTPVYQDSGYPDWIYSLPPDSGFRVHKIETKWNGRLYYYGHGNNLPEDGWAGDWHFRSCR